MSHKTENIRNIALIGHGSTGKTTLNESLLYITNTISNFGKVDDGKSVSDYGPEEIKRKISLNLSLNCIQNKDSKINILDTPGAGDFAGEVISALDAAESAVLLIDAEAGVQIETAKLWRKLEEKNYPRVIFINKIDKEHADIEKVLNNIKENFKNKIFIPLSVPYKDGVINILDEEYHVQDGKDTKIESVPADFGLDDYKVAVQEAAAESEDALMEKYLEGEQLTKEEIINGLKKTINEVKTIPIFCGSSLSNTGTKILHKCIIDLLPSPAIREEYKAVDESGNEITRKAGSGEPLSLFVFKTKIDQFAGKLSYCKVRSGIIKPDSDLFHVNKSNKEKLNKMYTSIGKDLIEGTEFECGDILILNKLESLDTFSTITSSDAKLKYPEITMPQPVFALAISAKDKKNDDKLSQLLHKATEEDKTFKIDFNKETKETVISGMGEQQINIIFSRIQEKNKIDVHTQTPKVAYRETITKSASSEYQHKKQSGGHGQYAKVVIEIKPNKEEHYNFENAIFGGAISKGYVPGCEKGFHEGMEEGVLASYPMTGISIKLIDGKEHPVDSSEMAFKLASRGALKDAVQNAGPLLLEPVMDVSVYVENKYLGDILSDLSSRRGRVLGQESVGGGIEVVKAKVPQAELLRYPIDLRSLTSGTGSFEVSFSHYDTITGKIAEDVIKAAKQEKEE